MKVLVATKCMQGTRSNDYSWTEEGELVGFALECDGEDVDGACGCRRGFAGLASHKATTTARVTEKGHTEGQYIAAYRLSKVRAGWVKPGEDPAWVREQAKEMLRIASCFTCGTIVEKRGDDIVERRKLVTTRIQGK